MDGDSRGALIHTVPVLQGRARRASAPRTVQLFGAVNTSEIGAPVTYAAFTQREGMQADRCTSRLGSFRIAMTGREVQRTGNLTPLTIQQINSGTPPPASPPPGIVSSMGARSQVKVAIGIHDGASCPRYLLFDLGQTIEVAADCITIHWVAPAAFVNVDRFLPGTVPAQAGLVIDALVAADIWEVESPIGEFRGHFTVSQFVAAGAQATIQVPDGTKAVRIFQSPLGNPAVSWTSFYGDPAITAGATACATLAFEPGLRRTPLLEIGDETHIRSDLDGATDRFFHVVFQIEP